MQLSKLFSLIFAFTAMPVLAQDITIIGTLDKTLKIPQQRQLTKSIQSTKNQSVKLLKIQLSNPGITALEKRTDAVINPITATIAPTNLPDKIALGMNHVPVLDQGSFGSCVTFATTGALNAALNQGDYISQLCQLQLGNYLEQQGYNPSGWEGTIARNVLSQIDNFGIINKEKQKTQGCGGLTEYQHINQSPLQQCP